MLAQEKIIFHKVHTHLFSQTEMEFKNRNQKVYVTKKNKYHLWPQFEIST